MRMKSEVALKLLERTKYDPHCQGILHQCSERGTEVDDLGVDITKDMIGKCGEIWVALPHHSNPYGRDIAQEVDIEVPARRPRSRSGTLDIDLRDPLTKLRTRMNDAQWFKTKDMRAKLLLHENISSGEENWKAA